MPHRFRYSNPIQDPDFKPIDGDDWLQYHEANYGVPLCKRCNDPEDLLLIMKSKEPVNGKRIFAIHMSHAKDLPPTS